MNDSATIQAALDNGGEVVFRAGMTWLHDGTTKLYPRSNSRIVIDGDLQVLPNTADTSHLFNLGGSGAVHNVTIEGNGRLIGDLLSRTGSYPSTLTFSATGGTFTLSSGGLTTAAITYSAALTAATIATALATAGITVTSVTGPNGGPYVITFPGAGAAYVNPASLTGGGATCVQVSQHGFLIYADNAVDVSILRPLTLTRAWGDGLYLGTSSAAAVALPAVTSVVIAGGIAVVTFASAHGLSEHRSIANTGFTFSGGAGDFNSTLTVTAVWSPTVLSFPTTATGSWLTTGTSTTTAAVRHISVDGVTADDNRRENFAVFHGEDVELNEVKSLNAGLTATGMGYGVSPSSGIDIEPNAGGVVLTLRILEPYISKAQGCGIYASPNGGTVTDLLVRAPAVRDCGLSPNLLTTYQWNGVHFASLVRPRLIEPDITGSGYDGLTNGKSGAVYFRSTQRAVLRGGYLQNNRGRGLFAESATFCDVSGTTIQENDLQAVTAVHADDSVFQSIRALDNVAAAATTAHFMLQQTVRGTLRGSIFRGNKGNYWVRVQTSGTDNEVSDNQGLGSIPTTAAYLDEATTTHAANNNTKTAGSSASW